MTWKGIKGKRREQSLLTGNEEIQRERERESSEC